MHSTIWLSWWIWHGVRISFGCRLNEEPMEGSDVDNLPTLSFRVPQAREYAQLLSNSAMEHPS